MSERDGGDREPRGGAASEITRLLRRHAEGDAGALDKLIPLVYDDLRKIAHDRLCSERASHTLDTTAVVHEAYLRLVDVPDPDWNDRAHFFAVSSKLIRNLLVDYARRRKADKRGGDAIRVPLNEELDAAATRGADAVDLLTLEAALAGLGLRDERLERVVECRFFGGLTVRETAQALNVSTRTVERDWTRARTYLYRVLGPGSAGGGE